MYFIKTSYNNKIIYPVSRTKVCVNLLEILARRVVLSFDFLTPMKVYIILPTVSEEQEKKNLNDCFLNSSYSGVVRKQKDLAP